MYSQWVLGGGGTNTKWHLFTGCGEYFSHLEILNKLTIFIYTGIISTHFSCGWDGRDCEGEDLSMQGLSPEANYRRNLRFWVSYVKIDRTLSIHLSIF